MTPRTLILIVAALIATGATVFFANSWLNRERAELEAMRNQPKEEPEPSVMVLVAKKPLPAGHFVTDDDIRWQAWPKDSVPETYVVKGTTEPVEVTGGVVRRGIEVGEPLNTGQIVTPGDRGFMAAVLNPGMRAVSVPVNAVTAVAGFVFPGDKVDLILTMNFVQVEEGESGDKQKRFGSETFLTGVRVLAIDQRAADQENKPSVAKTVTVEVTPEQAEMLAVAQQFGQISMALRSLARTDQDGPRATAAAIQMATNGAPKATPGERTVAGKTYEIPVPGGTYTLDDDASRLRRATLTVEEEGGAKIIQLRGGARQARSAE